MSHPIDLYKKKVERMQDEELRSEIKIHLIALSAGHLTKESKHRTTVLLQEGLSRGDMCANHDDFLVTLRVLRHL